MVKRFCFAVVCVMLAVVFSNAQVTTGTILGTVTDSTGAVIPGAAVTMRNVGTGASRTVTSDEAGRYRAPQLPLGDYEITSESAGFQTAVRTGISLTVGREAMVDFAMQVGAVAERITVTGEAPLIETTNATVASLVSEESIRDLPLNGRSFTDLTAIQPGVVSDIGIDSSVFGGGKRISVNGARPQQSLYLLDGTDIVAPYMNVTPNSVLGEFLGVDTIREFSLIRTNAGAQYGRAVGGIINAVTQSGTNDFHGGLFEFIRNDKMDANNFFLNRANASRDNKIKPAFRRNQFGGTLGGPIQKDKTFFFLSYEGLQHRKEVAQDRLVLSREARLGNIAVCPGNVYPCSTPSSFNKITVNEAMRPLINMIIEPNTISYERNGVSHWVGTNKDSGKENYWMARVDRRLGDNDNIYGRITMDTSDLDSQRPINLNAIPSGISVTSEGKYYFSAIEHTHIFSPTVLNSARVAFNRNNVTQQDRFTASEFPDVAFVMPVAEGSSITARDGLPSLACSSCGLTISPSGLGGGSYTRFVDNTYILSDTINWNPGAHAVTFGINVNRYQMNGSTGPWGWGDITFASEANFLAGSIGNMINPKFRGDYYRGWRQTYGAGFVQDDWSVRSGLTVNFGLRWERVTAPVEVNGKMAGLVDILRDSKYTTFEDSLFTLRDGLKGFAPRVGFAYTPSFLGSNTVMRGAAGIFREIPLLYQYQLAFFVPPWAEKVNLVAPPWPNPISNYTGILTAGEPNVMDRDMKYPYVVQWNYSLEHQINESLVAKATYIGTHSINLVGPTNADQWIPVRKFDPTIGAERWYTPCGLSGGLRPAGCTAAQDSEGGSRPNPAWASTRTFHNLGDAYYNAVQVELEQRNSGGVTYNVSYTFSKNMDTTGLGNKCAETTGAGASFYIGNLYDLRSERGLSNLHTPHNVTGSFGYEMPFGQGKKFGSGWGTIPDLILGGWQFNGTVSARSGQQNNLTLGILNHSRNGASFRNDRPDLKPGRSNSPTEGVSEGCSAVPQGTPLGTVDQYYDPCAFSLQPAGFYGNLGRQSLAGPGIKSVNISVFKGISLGESRNLQFRAEFFNISNTPSFSGPGQTTFVATSGAISSAAGKITALRTSPRNIQFGLKFNF